MNEPTKLKLVDEPDDEKFAAAKLHLRQLRAFEEAEKIGEWAERALRKQEDEETMS